MAEHTPGPWEWRLFGHGALALCTVGRGCIIVMDFVRKGTQSAQPRFGKRSRADEGGLMVKAEDWPDGIDSHPDARLIAAAPDLLAACKALLEDTKDRGRGGGDTLYLSRAMAIDAVAKAEGQS